MRHPSVGFVEYVDDPAYDVPPRRSKPKRFNLDLTEVVTALVGDNQ